MTSPVMSQLVWRHAGETTNIYTTEIGCVINMIFKRCWDNHIHGGDFSHVLWGQTEPSPWQALWDCEQCPRPGPTAHTRANPTNLPLPATENGKRGQRARGTMSRNNGACHPGGISGTIIPAFYPPVQVTITRWKSGLTTEWSEDSECPWVTTIKSSGTNVAQWWTSVWHSPTSGW